jgi:ribosomal protein S27E
MTDIIDFGKARKERERHVSGELYCRGCNHEWTAVWEPGTTEFECPECKSMRGRNKFNVSPAPGTEVWSCVHCDNQLFTLLKDRVHCSGCGQQWSYGDIA